MSVFGLEPGESALFINGLQAHLDIYDVFSLLDTMRDEAKLMEGLYNLGSQVIKFRYNNNYIKHADSQLKQIIVLYNIST